ncbi:MAG: pilus assembly protein PilM [Proteobacteria bacterium]|nr:pilus assembly protein PilM [Pseudomonadota bacterium]
MIFDIESRYPIGIDIGAKYIAAAQLRDEKGKKVLRGLHYRKLDAGTENDDILVSALREITKSKVFAGRRVVLSIPSKNLSIFPIHFQIEKTGSLEEAILRESEKYLPFPLEDAVIDYPSLLSEESGDFNQYKALIVAARREDLKKYMALLKDAGLHVDVFDFSVSALIRLHYYLYQKGPNPVILGHIGLSKSLFAVASQESIVVQRDVGWGSEVMLEEFLSSIDISHDNGSAKAILKRHGLSYEDHDPAKADQEKDSDTIGIERAVYQIITPHIDEFLHEMDKGISYARVEARSPEFEGIYLYGQAGIVSSLDKYIERRMNIRTEIVNPLDRIPLSDKRLLAAIPDDAPLALALGLSMRRVPWL